MARRRRKKEPKKTRLFYLRTALPKIVASLEREADGLVDILDEARVTGLGDIVTHELAHVERLLDRARVARSEAEIDAVVEGAFAFQGRNPFQPRPN